MTQKTAATAQTAGQSPEPKFAVQRIYIKDLSFETPQGIKVFQKQWKPKVNQDLSTKSSKVDEGLYEVSLRITITVTDDDDTIYLVEVEQGGLFSIDGLTDQQLTQVLNTTCPTMLFPYIREAIDNTVTKGSFPALMIPPINFDALFASAVQKASQENETKPEEGTKH